MMKKLSILAWSVTGIIAITLLGLTINLSIQAMEQGESNTQAVSAYLSNDYPRIILLVEPHELSLVASIQERGTPITVVDYVAHGEEDWFQVTVAEDSTGWVQGKYITLERP